MKVIFYPLYLIVFFDSEAFTFNPDMISVFAGYDPGFSFLFHRKDNKSFFAAKFTLLLFITMPTTSKRFIQEAQVPYEVHSNMLLIDDQVHNVLGSSIGRKAVI
ncbi:hypothetical protein PHJA_001331100 [Phtheirospermum japonicum]|uniref:Uncharacterized protein n=1 Tax=Phtheirospermum japonicum TaxID=374723 RepID=A0A830BWP7_9LAMI|nr:hypothetical protein PHJA_001331100 [Phtheirospermum japonicum]